jgi:hypothetical protein
MGGSIIPVSALVKSSTSTWNWYSELLTKAEELSNSTIPQLLDGKIPPVLFGFLGLIGFLILIGFLTRYSNSSNEQSVFQKILYGLFLGMITYHLIIIARGIESSPYFVWYRSPLFIFLIITFCYAVSMIQNLFFNKGFQFAPQLTMVLGLIIIGVSGLWFVQKTNTSISRADDLSNQRYRAAIWISENLPEDAVLASWNAGELGYFSNRPVINLDGLINSVDYYEAVLTGPVSLTDYLKDNQVDYVVDYADNELTASLSVVGTFAKPNGNNELLRIWVFDPMVAFQTKTK